jgi:signal transduction histidine kinase
MRLIRSFTTEQTDAGEILIEIGGVSFSRLRTAISVASDMAVPIAVLLLATILAAVMVVPVLIVRPVRRVAAAADVIHGAGEGVRLPEEGGPLELMSMVSSFNRALDRIDAAAAEQRRFLSNAAHELRKPLARAPTRVEGVDDPHLKAALVDDLQTLSATVTMLLQLARLSAGAAETREIDLVAIARCVAAEYAPGALKSGVEIEFSGPAQAVKT